MSTITILSINVTGKAAAVKIEFSKEGKMV